MFNAVESNGVAVVRTPTGVGVSMTAMLSPDVLLLVEVDYQGRRLKADWLHPNGPPWRDSFGPAVDHLRVALRVKQGDRLLAELPAPGAEILPFMVLQGPQHHVTENYASVPPCLTITDERGAVWTLGFETAPKDQSPAGEFAFAILRDGLPTGEIGSRIERRGGQVRVFTRHGWRRWNQDGLYFV